MEGKICCINYYDWNKLRFVVGCNPNVFKRERYACEGDKGGETLKQHQMYTMFCTFPASKHHFFFFFFFFHSLFFFSLILFNYLILGTCLHTWDSKIIIFFFSLSTMWHMCKPSHTSIPFHSFIHSFPSPIYFFLLLFFIF